MVIILMSYVSNYYDCPKPKYYYGISYFFLNIYIYMQLVGEEELKVLFGQGEGRLLLFFFFCK